MLESNQFVQPLRSVYRGMKESVHPDDTFHWYEGGDPNNETIVMMHGYMAHSLTFRRVFEYFLDDYHVVIPDLPGHGRDLSYRHRQPTMAAMTTWAEDLFGLIKPAHVIAHSLGASVAYDARDAADLKTLTLVDPGIWIPSRRIDEWALSAVPPMLARVFARDITLRIFERVQFKGPRMSKRERDSYVEPLKDPVRLKYMTQLGADMLRCAREERHLTPPDCRALVIWGDHDRILPVEDAPKLADELDADLHIFEDAGHSPPEDAPEEFSKIVLEFLTEG